MNGSVHLMNESVQIMNDNVQKMNKSVQLMNSPVPPIYKMKEENIERKLRAKRTSTRRSRLRKISKPSKRTTETGFYRGFILVKSGVCPALGVVPPSKYPESSCILRAFLRAGSPGEIVPFARIIARRIVGSNYDVRSFQGD